MAPARTSAFTRTPCLALMLLLGAPLAYGFSTGSGTCFTNGVAFHPSPSAGSGGFVLSAPADYMPGEVVPITLSGSAPFIGVLLYALDDNLVRFGQWQVASGYQILAACTGANTLSHASNASKSVPVVFNWTAPAAFTGTVTFNILVMKDTLTSFDISGLSIAEAVFRDGFD